MTERYANLAQTTLNGAINNSVTSVVVTSASSFPGSGNFRIVIDTEILLVTAVSGSTFTATRGAESSTAASHVDGSTVALVITAGSYAQGIVDYAASNADHYVVTTSAGDLTNQLVRNSFINYSADNAPASPSVYDDEFNTGSLSGGWTSYNSPSLLSASNFLGYLQIENTAGTDAGCYKSFAPGATPFSIAVRLLYSMNANFSYSGIVCYDSLGTTQEGCLQIQCTNFSGMQLRFGSTSGFFGTAVTLPTVINTIYLVLQRDGGTNWAVYWSANGIQWRGGGVFVSPGSTIARLGLMCNSQGGTSSAVYDYVRVFPSQTLIIGSA